MCEWGSYLPWHWAQNIAHLWRTTGDINANWTRIMDIYEQNVGLEAYSWSGAFNDPDMMCVGMPGLNGTQNRAHFSLWAIMDAPLIIGTDVRSIDNDSLSVLKNTVVIGVN